MGLRCRVGGGDGVSRERQQLQVVVPLTRTANIRAMEQLLSHAGPFSSCSRCASRTLARGLLQPRPSAVCRFCAFLHFRSFPRPS